MTIPPRILGTAPEMPLPPATVLSSDSLNIIKNNNNEFNDASTGKKYFVSKTN